MRQVLRKSSNQSCLSTTILSYNQTARTYRLQIEQEFDERLSADRLSALFVVFIHPRPHVR